MSTPDIHPKYEITSMQVFGSLLYVAAALLFCACVFMRKQIMLAISIVEQAAKALTALPTLLALPVMQAIAFTIFMVPWIIYVIYLASSGDSHRCGSYYPHDDVFMCCAVVPLIYGCVGDTETYTSSYTNDGVTYNYTYREFNYTKNSKFAFIFLVFCLFWVNKSCVVSSSSSSSSFLLVI